VATNRSTAAHDTSITEAGAAILPMHDDCVAVAHPEGMIVAERRPCPSRRARVATMAFDPVASSTSASAMGTAPPHIAALRHAIPKWRIRIF